MASLSRRQRRWSAAIAIWAAGAMTTACSILAPSPAWYADPTYHQSVDVDRVRAQITRLRADYGRPPPLYSQVLDHRLASAQERVDAGTSPEVALEFALQGGADDGERDVRFWILKVDDLKALSYPRQLLSVARLNLSIAVYRQRADQHPRYAVLLATPSLDEFRVRL